MKLAFLALATATACHSSPGPAPTPTPPLLDLDASIVVLNELVEAGCLALDDSSLPAIEAQHASDQPTWLACLYDGGTVASCKAPCEEYYIPLP